ncbi:hypothetical protein CHLNCDRAFT_140572 [Chlorella variabilis]|uniref:SCP domain-containing protein n=1 Tax=Chlorella variabilis TaxID=554065 RepID=E1Z5P8_CHLVA|nr:hypothetical protein CHLNCDRAFT_140572 [Chlorella variabilis]EFN58793.1 hypothetical protein CHLNCDRAFT_140572 [Chlorella variabilis]|eukprot:XP_005850895.1 hypothetical protein CHLNCDRAFT_140572 [Chlorella variabilis]
MASANYSALLCLAAACLLAGMPLANGRGLHQTASVASTTFSRSGTSSASSSASSTTQLALGNAATVNNDAQKALDAMNAARTRRGTAPLSWTASLAQGAQSWAQGCVFQHSNSGLGENLYRSSAPATCSDAVNMWLAEERYSPAGNMLGQFAANV